MSEKSEFKYLYSMMHAFPLFIVNSILSSKFQLGGHSVVVLDVYVKIQLIHHVVKCSTPLS